MNILDRVYHIAFSEDLPGTIVLKPDEQTADRFYENTYQLPARPLRFTNAFRTDMARDGVRESIADVLFDGQYFMVTDRVYELISGFNIAGLRYYPAVFDAENGTLHNYWFLIFDGASGRDWFDREHSVIAEEDDRHEGDKPFIERYSLDIARLHPIPEERRLMFRMTGVMVPLVFVHQRIVDLFARNQVTGIRFFRVDEYEDGRELD